jgi:hypothetical protein
MFKYDCCKKISLPCESMNKKIVSTRDVSYWNLCVLSPITKKKEYYSYPQKDIGIIKKFEKDGYKVLKDFFTKGSEIKKEKSICKQCSMVEVA